MNKLLPVIALGLLFFSCSHLKDPAATGSADCNACHAKLPGLHTFHAQMFDCSSCHTGYAGGDSANVNPITHKNGTVDVAFGAAAGPRAAYNSATNSCSFISCHGNLGGGSLPVSWTSDSALACGACHSIPPASGLHHRHADSGAAASCVSCHPASTNDSTHNNGRLDIRFSAAAGTQAKYDTAAHTCSNINCHGSMGGTSVPVSWTADTVLACGSCHAIPPAAGAHQFHADSGSAVSCEKCHPAATAATHNNGAKNVSLNPGLAGASAHFDSTAKTCSNVYCHGAFTGGAFAVMNWNSTTPLSCTSCHATPPSAGAHQSHVAAGDTAACRTCHPAAVGVGHENGRLQVVLSGAAGTSAIYDSAARSCTNVACHGAGSGTLNWNMTAAQACGACHAVPPVTGAHRKHTNPATYHISCDSCHPSLPSATLPFKTGTHMNGTVDISFRGTNAAQGAYTARTCSDIYCHNGGRTDTLSGDNGNGFVYWKTARTFSWDSTLTCQGCHDAEKINPPSTTNHGYMCGYCHDPVVVPAKRDSIASYPDHLQFLFQ